MFILFIYRGLRRTFSLGTPNEVRASFTEDAGNVALTPFLTDNNQLSNNGANGRRSSVRMSVGRRQSILLQMPTPVTPLVLDGSDINNTTANYKELP